MLHFPQFILQIMCSVALSFIFTLLTTFAGYRAARAFDAVVFFRVLNNAVWSVYYIVFALTVITMCSLATREVFNFFKSYCFYF
jgi:hypothetical protein